MMCVLPVYVYLHVGITYKHDVSGVMCSLKLTPVAQLAATLVSYSNANMLVQNISETLWLMCIILMFLHVYRLS